MSLQQLTCREHRLVLPAIKTSGNGLICEVWNFHMFGLLLGQDVAEALTPVDVRKGSTGKPYAVRTALGWTLNGSLGMRGTSDVVSNFIQSDQRLDDKIEQFWKLDTAECLADNSLHMSRDDKRVLKIWDESARKVNGHYEMNIPFKCRPPNLPNNYCVAEARLESLDRRLSKDSVLLQKYQTGIQELLDKGFAEVSEKDVDRPDEGVWYLPHHGVTNVHKPDKLRIVFDCAAQYCGTSLNDQLLQGPDLTNKLIGVLLRFREGQVGIMGDIEGMFHQVQVPAKDRDYLRFLWWADKDRQQVAVYRMTVHLFGGVWSPSCASYALRRSAEDNCTKYSQEIVGTVLENFYVDDCLKSLSTETEAIQHVKDLCSIVAEGGFKLLKWVSNSRKVLYSIPEDRRAKELNGIELNKGELPTERALGVLWNTQKDQHGFKIVQKVKPLTRRGVMSVISSVYDPLGFVSPVILQAKKIFQSECRARKGWDEPLCRESASKWTKWTAELPELEKFEIPRCVTPAGFGSVLTSQLHHFSDASNDGYGAVSYLRQVNQEGQISCSLLISKSRLAPIKPMTIPRLELSAAVVSVRLDLMLRKELKMDITKSVFWTDSTIVLQYIKSEHRRFHTFVANRVAIIHDGSAASQWRHVDSENNPADDVSRGLDARQIVTSTRWRNGPEFLWNEETSWPDQRAVECEIPSGDREVKAEPKVYKSKIDENDVLNRMFQRYSSWYKLKRAVAWLLRLKAILQSKTKGQVLKSSERTLSVVELREAETAIVRVVQEQTYPDELFSLKRKQSVKRSSHLCKFEPRLNSNDIICVGGRLEAAPLADETKHQAILPRDNHVTNLIIRECHELCGHSGREHVMSALRQKFWIPKARRTVSKILSGCVPCRRRQVPPCSQRMNDLPADRITPGDPPFTNVGIDCFGPYLVKRGRSQVKRYGCLFTCLTTRAVHVEKLDSMDTDSSLNGFVRFVSRRGRPNLVRSDNGTNFRAGEAELRRALQDLNQTQINNFMVQRDICWIFNPPAASHMGGVWERQIRTFRKVMNAIATAHLMDDESLNTLFCETESIMNSRPITTVSDNPRDLNPLTPNHLLLLGPGPGMPVLECGQADAYRRRWKHVQFAADGFWKRWVREYLPSLQLRQKWLVPKRNIKVGDIVLILDENTPRRQWPLGRVETTFPGSDGLVRSADIRTRWTTLRRPIHKLCLLEGAVDD